LPVAIIVYLSHAVAIVPILHPIGPAEIVWNKTKDACPQTKSLDNGDIVLCEEPDSMPIAWHNPMTNTSYLISSTDCTYAAVGKTLDAVGGRHDCSHTPYKAINDSRPWTYENHQWLQSARVFANGTGFAYVHNEFHGEQRPHNVSYCSFQSKTSTGQCIEWSTDLAATVDGGRSWDIAHAPLITLPRRYIKDAAIAGYGELGSSMYHEGFYYAHVSRSYDNNTGGGPPNTKGGGTCVFRSNNPTNPATYRGWNGSAWSTTWINPYTAPAVPADRLWEHTCASVRQGTTDKAAKSAAHLNPKKFAGELTAVEGWPTHTMTGLPPGKLSAATTYYFPNTTDWGDAPFSNWVPASTGQLVVDEWMDPCTIGGGRYDWMYPNLIDHASPFALSHPDSNRNDAGGEDADALASDGLSYGLVGNRSLYLYGVLSREFIVRIPVAWFLPNQTLPTAPFPPQPPPKLNPVSCLTMSVTGASNTAVNGIYRAVGPAPTPGPGATALEYTKDAQHKLYNFQKLWKLGRPGKGGRVYYSADRTKPGMPWLPVPVTGWDGSCDSLRVTCMEIVA